MAPVLLGAGATVFVVGVALFSPAAAVVAAGFLLMLAALALAAVQERRPKRPEAPPA